MAIFTIAPFTGPALGPTVAGYVITSGLSWRWVFYIMTIFVIILFLFLHSLIYLFPVRRLLDSDHRQRTRNIRVCLA